MRLNALDAPLETLERLPRGLWLGSLANGVGDPYARVAFAERARVALLCGQLPAAQFEANAFEFTFQSGFRNAIAELGLAAFAVDKPDTADQILRTLLWHCDRIAQYRDQLGDTHDEARARAVHAFTEEWKDTVETWQEVYAIFDSIGGLDMATDPSAMKGLLARSGWQAVKHAHAMVQNLPELKKMIASLGRSVPIPAAQIAQREPVRVTREEEVVALALRAAPVDRHGADVDSIIRSDDLAAMVPAESLLRRRPVLRTLWRARYVEHALMTYERRVTLDSPTPTPQKKSVTRTVMLPPPQFETGPIIVCVDTSSSMKGAKEWLVKATVFEAMRVAHIQKRACYLYAFSDETSLTEHTLSLDAKGLEALVDFLELSFRGGTDVAEPITRAVERVRDEAWRAADILIASDGEFGVPRAVETIIAQAKSELKLKIVGVLAGDRETIGMRAICDENLWIKDWRRFELAGQSADSPVHSKSLTAMYFPNAMR
jgi:uncharacterized protein with von Willebrand factor type A (vWA) domain